MFAFGPRARRWAARLRTDVPVIVSEPGEAAAALSQALELRRSGARFFVSLDFEDPRDGAVRAVSRDRAQVVRTVDELRVTLDAYVVEELGAFRTPPGQLGALHALILLSHGILVRSAEELVRLRDALGVVDREADVVVCVDDSVPAVVAEAPTDVVVWAPHETPAELGMFVTALQDLLLPVTIVAAEAAPLPGNIRIVAAAEGAAALARARLVIDATTNDPGVAVALARLGRPLAVTSSGGAATFVRGSVSYERGAGEASSPRVRAPSVRRHRACAAIFR